MKRERIPQRHAPSHGLTAALAVTVGVFRLGPTRGGRLSVRAYKRRSLRRLVAALLSQASALTLLACASGELDGYETPRLRTVDISRVFPSDGESIARQHDGACQLVRDTSCLVDDALQCESHVPAVTEIAPRGVSRPDASESVASSSALPSHEHVVEARRTPLSGKEAAKRLERAYRKQVGRRPSRETLELLTAHWAHETNQGASMFNFNFGGIKGVGPDGAYVLNPTREGWGARERRRNHRFRAYANATDGAVDYLSLLQRLYGPALEAAAVGDAVGFVEGLKEGGYFSGDQEIYLQKVTAFIGFAREWGLDALGPAGISPLDRASGNTSATRS